MKVFTSGAVDYFSNLNKNKLDAITNKTTPFDERK